jgi:hypothetical protein
MRSTLVVLLILSAAASVAFAGSDAVLLEHPRPGEQSSSKRSRWWKASVALLAASSAVDAHSSWGRMEANPVLRNGSGRFGMQGVAIKAMVLGGVVGAQYLLLRKGPQAERFGTVTNVVFSGVLVGAAVSNHRRH